MKLHLMLNKTHLPLRLFTYTQSNSEKIFPSQERKKDLYQKYRIVLYTWKIYTRVSLGVIYLWSEQIDDVLSFLKPEILVDLKIIFRSLFFMIEAQLHHFWWPPTNNLFMIFKRHPTEQNKAKTIKQTKKYTHRIENADAHATKK